MCLLQWRSHSGIFTIAIPYGILTVFLTAGTVYFAGIWSYETAIKELIEHEVTDLGDETRKNADRIRDRLAMLRENVLSLSQHPAVVRWVNADKDRSQDRDLRTAIIEATENQWQFPQIEGPDNGAEDLQKSDRRFDSLKPFLHVQLVGADAYGLVRVLKRESLYSVGQSPNQSLVAVPLDELDEDSRKPGKADCRYYSMDDNCFSFGRQNAELLNSSHPK